MSITAPSYTPIYVGIDIGKRSHAWCLLSGPLLKQKKRYQSCPSGSIKNQRADFERLLAIARTHAGDRTVHILMEHTGHYGFPFEQFLQEQPNIKIYRCQASSRYGRDKTDRKDSQALAVRLYNQISLQAPVTNERDRITRLLPPTLAAAQLRPLVQHRVELVREIVQRENRLTAILDQLFPELTQIFAEPNGPSALNLRELYPTAQMVSVAKLADLIATRTHTRPGNSAFVKAQMLAKESIGLKAGPRQASLVLEQYHLIQEMRLLLKHKAEMDTRIEEILLLSREGQILCSFPGIGSVLAAQLLAGIGNVANFESIAKFRAYVGWAPRRSQTGTTFDHSSLDRSGNRLCKQAMHQVAIAAIRHSPRWAALHTRLSSGHAGKMTSLGRIAGQIAGVIYLLLAQDVELVRSWRGDERIPEPRLYDMHR